MSEEVSDPETMLFDWIYFVYDFYRWNKGVIDITMKLVQDQMNKNITDNQRISNEKLAATIMLIVGKAYGENIDEFKTGLTTDDGPLDKRMTADELMAMERDVLRKIIDDALIFLF